MPRRRNPFVQWCLTTAAVLFGRLTSLLPLPVCHALGRLLGRAAYWLVPRVRRVALANLDLAYGDDLGPREKRRIAKTAAENVGIVAAEFSHIPKLDADFVRRHVTVRGQEHIDLERGGFIIGAHLGNWEWMAPVVFALGGRTAEVVRPLDDPRLDAFVDRTRRSTGVVTIPKTGAGPELLRLLRDGCIVGVLVDQSPRENGVPVQFYGKPCWGTVAPVMVAARARKPAYPIAMTRDANGRYTVEFAPPIEMVRSGDLRADLIENSQRCQSAIEELVRRHPEQWLWLHRRWKPRPRLEAEWQERNRRGGTEE